MDRILSPEQSQLVFEQTRRALTTVSAPNNLLGGPNKIKCWSCKIGINAACAGAIAAALGVAVAFGAPEAAAASVAAIVAVTALSETAIWGIITTVAATVTSVGVGTVEAVIEKLCEAMKACA